MRPLSTSGPTVRIGEHAVDERDDVVRPADQLQVGGEAAGVEEVVARMLDRGRDEAGAGERGQRVVVAKMRAAGAVRVDDERKGARGRGRPAHGGDGEGADLRRAGVRPGRIEDDGRHRPALHGIDELQIEKAGGELLGLSRTPRHAGKQRRREQEDEVQVSHAARSLKPATGRSDSMGRGHRDVAVGAQARREQREARRSSSC